MSEDSEVVCLTNPFKPIQPGVIKMERSDDVQIISSKNTGPSSSSNHVSPTSNGPTSLATALSNALARRSTSPADPPGSDFEELRMLRTLLQRATEKNKSLKLQKEKILLKRKILAVERENNSLKDEIGGLEKQPLSAATQSTLRTPLSVSGVRVPAAQLPLRLNNSYNSLHRQQQVAKAAHAQLQHHQAAQQQNSHLRPNHAAQSMMNKHFHQTQQVSRYQNPAAAALAHRLQNPHWSAQNRQYQQMQKPLNHLPNTTSYYPQQQVQQAAAQQQQQHTATPVVGQPAPAPHLVQHHNQVQQQQQPTHQVNRLQHVSAAVPQQRHPNSGSSNHAALAAVNKILNGSSLSGIATSLSAAATNLSSAHNTLLNNHAGMHTNQTRHVQGRPISQQVALTNTVNVVNTGSLVNNPASLLNTSASLVNSSASLVNSSASLVNNGNSNNTVEVSLLKTPPVSRESQPRVSEQQINDLIKSALQKGGYEHFLTQMMARTPSSTPTSSAAPYSFSTNNLETSSASSVSDVISSSTGETVPTSMESEESGGLGACNTVQISGANEDVEVDIGIPENDQTSISYSNNFNEQTSNDDLATFTELFAMSDDPLNVTSPTVNMTTAADPITSSNGNMTSGEDSATLNTTSETSQQAYDLSKLDNATLEQLISSVCSLCSGDVTQNKNGVPEELLTCSDCSNSGHPSCLQFSAELTEKVKTYSWQCIECKTCVLCGQLGDDNTILFCDDCDKGFHTGCLSPALPEVPEGNWSCEFCKGISVPSTDVIARSSSSSRDILLQKANKVINNASSDRSPAEMMQKTEEIIASLLATGTKRSKSNEAHKDAPSSKRALLDI